MNKIFSLYTYLSCFFHSPLIQKNKGKLLFLSLVLLLFSGILIRMIAMEKMPEHFWHNDGGDYLNISEQLARGNGFSKTLIHWYEAAPPDYHGEAHSAFHRPPVLPLIGAVFYFLPFDVHTSAMIFVLLTGALCILAVYFLTKEIFMSRKTAFLAAVLYTFYPYSIYHGICYSSENCFILFLCGSFCFLSRCIWKDLSILHAFLCGGMMALATLTRPQGFGLFLILGFTGTLIMLLKKELRKKLFRALVFYTLGSFLILSPWMLRNYLAAGKATPLTFYGDYSFAQASSDVSYMSYRYVDTPQYKEITDKTWIAFHHEKREILARKGIYDLPSSNPYWKKWAWEYIRQNPQKMAYIVWNRILHCFRAVPNTAATGMMVTYLIRLYFIPFILLFFVGIYFARKNIRALLLLLSPVTVLFFAIPFLMLLRYRYPFFAPVAALFASYGLISVIEQYFTFLHKRQKM